MLESELELGLGVRLGNLFDNVVIFDSKIPNLDMLSSRIVCVLPLGRLSLILMFKPGFRLKIGLG
jgi:hypothetical protein